MPRPQVAGVVECRMQYNSTLPMSWVMHLLVAGGGTRLAACERAASLLSTHARAQLHALHPANILWRAVRWVDLDPATYGMHGSDHTGTGQAGLAATATANPFNVAIGVEKLSPLSARQRPGILKVSAPQEADVGAVVGLITTGAIANYLAKFNAFLAAMNAPDGAFVHQPVVLHRDLTALDGYSPQPITGFRVQAQVMTTRTRLIRVGR